MSRLAVVIASVGYVGFIPVAPGTFGTAAGLALLVALRAFAPPGADLAAILVTFVVGVWASTVAERALARTDPGPVVIDEVLGTFITMALLPVSLPVAVAGFLLFRIFDVIKPFPARRLESAPGGLGVMLDDAMAGIYAHLTLRLTIAMAPGWVS
jgi:phosphatidylglycerophosphatase A